jgi:hypothetical protein
VTHCIHHPRRASVITINLQPYCAQCRDGIAAARLRDDRHLEPKDCFVFYASANKWQPIIGTGCAHWVAHQRGIRRKGQGEQCLEGYTCRVRTLIEGLQRVAVQNVQVNDIYVTPTMDYAGLVVRVAPNALPGKPPVITIRHDSSSQGCVADNDFGSHFHVRGTFYR